MADYTGSHISDGCSLRAEDIRAGQIVIHQSKADHPKTVVMMPLLDRAIGQTNTVVKAASREKT